MTLRLTSTDNRTTNEGRSCTHTSLRRVPGGFEVSGHCTSPTVFFSGIGDTVTGAAVRDVLGHFWSESYGQIYPALAELERLELVQRSGSARTRSSTFAVTPAGTRRLRELLAQPIQPAPARNGLLLRLFFGRTLGAEACRALIAEAKADAEQRLLGFDELTAPMAGEPQYADEAPSGSSPSPPAGTAPTPTIAWARNAALVVLRRGGWGLLAVPEAVGRGGAT